MESYEERIAIELSEWQSTMQRMPNFSSSAIKDFQIRINRLIPEKIHQIVTKTIKELTRAVLFGADHTTNKNNGPINLNSTEDLIKERINFYTSTASAEGAITGFGGFISGLADFPLWLSIKMKMLFEVANQYGFDTSDYKERIYLLYVFQIAFSSQKRRIELFHLMSNWETEQYNLPENIHDFDWRTFQLEYRDHVDLAKLFQLIPGVGAVVGAYVNHRLTNRLGKTAMNAYRMRLVNNGKLLTND